MCRMRWRGSAAPTGHRGEIGKEEFEEKKRDLAT
jgi:hypothetical protein